MIIRPNSLSREILNSLVLCGLVLFAVGLVTSGRFTSVYSLQLLLLSIASLGAVLLLVILGRMRGRVSAADALESQLCSISGPANGPTEYLENLHPIFTHSSVTQGWNRIVGLVNERQLDQSIERRLTQNPGGRKTERLGRAVRSLAEGVAISDRQGKINYVNPAWITLFGAALEHEPQFIGARITQYLEGLNCVNWEQINQAVLQGSKPISLSLKRGAAVQDGVLQLNRLPLEGRVNESEGFVWTLKDTTQSTLASESHEQFLSSATHELRTPLTNIRAYTESLLEMDDISPQQQKEFFNIIYSESERLGRLLNQLLDIQQLEAGSMTIQVAAFDVLRMVQEVTDQIQPVVADKQLKFTCRIAPNLKTIRADKEKLTSCLVNLLGNAVKYTPAGGEIKLIAEQNDSHISICVEDTGIGIAEDELPKVFERFYRCQDERVADLEGNGLGLSFCMEVARLHQAELFVESQLNKGSRFTLQLPVAQ